MRKFSVLLALGALAASSNAVTAFSNLDDFSGYLYTPGGATASLNATYLDADDLLFETGTAGQAVTSVTFTLGNLNTSAVSVDTHLRFYSLNSTQDGIGSLLASIDLNPITEDASSIDAYTVTDAGGFFNVPADEFVFAGISFSSTSATPAQMANVGQGLFGTPTIGDSGDIYFESDGPGTFDTGVPAGGFYDLGGDPVANFGWEFETQAVPEPSAFAALGLSAVALLRRRKKA